MTDHTQPPPTPNSERPLIEHARELLARQEAAGLRTYGTRLQVGNGRDFGRDADEEAADWFLYALGFLEEHRRRVRNLLRIIGELKTENDALKAARKGEK